MAGFQPACGRASCPTALTEKNEVAGLEARRQAGRMPAILGLNASSLALPAPGVAVAVPPALQLPTRQLSNSGNTSTPSGEPSASAPVLVSTPMVIPPERASAAVKRAV